ncbi:tryptophan-rich sensory protein [Salmonella enterica subsp. enterica serovar Enteritidis]|nr:tryptophan-rich sensory protein [Salmonella enterica subsp. enterica serovar Enteritidis]
MKPRYGLLVVFLALVVGVGLLIGYLNVPGEWYAGLVKPSFTPPDWIFAPVWTVLYIFIAVVGWRTYRRRRGTTMALWWIQLALNFAWSPLFFGLHMVGFALAVIIALFGVVVSISLVARRVDPVSSGLFIPYALWVGYATALNAAIFLMN